MHRDKDDDAASVDDVSTILYNDIKTPVSSLGDHSKHYNLSYNGLGNKMQSYNLAAAFQGDWIATMANHSGDLSGRINDSM